MSAASPWAAAADPTRRVGHAVEFHPVIGSTNDRARELVRAPGGEGVAVVAELQTTGRGRQGRTWLSPPGTNLMVSVGLRSHLGVTDAWRLSAVAALAACAAAEPVARLSIKWPNDLYSTDGLKVGGILIETAIVGERVAEAVVGLGMNVHWSRAEMPAELAAGATSLRDLAATEVDRVALLARYLGALDRYVAEIDVGASPAPALRARSWLDGRWVRVDGAASSVEGRVSGIGENGELILETARGRESVAFGEVVQVRPAREIAA